MPWQIQLLFLCQKFAVLFGKFTVQKQRDGSKSYLIWGSSVLALLLESIFHPEKWELGGCSSKAGTFHWHGGQFLEKLRIFLGALQLQVL